MCCDCPKNWSMYIPLAEWWYNTNFHTSAQTTPYEIVYPLHLPYLPGETKVEAVDRSLQKREEMIRVLQFHLRRAQDRMKASGRFKERSDRQFAVGSWIWL